MQPTQRQRPIRSLLPPKNPVKTMVLPLLPPVAALNFPVIIFERRTQWKILPDFISQKKKLNRSSGRSNHVGVEKTVIDCLFLPCFSFCSFFYSCKSTVSAAFEEALRRYTQGSCVRLSWEPRFCTGAHLAHYRR